MDIEFENGQTLKCDSYDDMIKLYNFDDIVYMECYGQELMNITKLPKKLIELYLPNNCINALPKLPDTLEVLEVPHNVLYELPELPKKLKELNCENNILHKLPDKLPDTLIELNCSDNNITKLPILPKLLEYLYVDKNQLTYLPRLPIGLLYIECETNKLIELPIIPHTVFHIYYCDNPIYKTIKKYFNSRYTYNEYIRKTETIYANKIRNWFLDHRYNPEREYCKKRLLKECNELYPD